MAHPLHHTRNGLLLLMLAAAVGAQAQTDTCKNQLTIGLNFMAHGEVRGGGLPRPSSTDETVGDNARFLLGRTRLTVDYQRKGIEVKAVAQNQAVWGQKNNSNVTLYEGWAKLTAPFGLFAQLGRIALAYDDERIIGPNDWAMAAKAHDVLRIGYEGGGHKVHALLAYNQNPENMTTGTFYTGGAQPYKSMQVLWYHYDLPKVPLGASLMLMNIGMQAGTQNDNPHTENQQLVGAYVKFQPKRWKMEASYYRQMGYNEKEINIRAWMASGKVTFSPRSHYGFEAGYDYLSGDDYVAVPKPGTMGLPRHEVIKGFNTLYGSHHKFFGVMDYFYESAYINEFTPGLQNAFVGGFFKPVKPLTLRLAYHYMAVATHLEGLGMTLGHDFDLEASYRFSKDIMLSAGFSYMAGTETLNRLKQDTGNKSVRWGWFSLIVSPTLFTTRW